MRKLLACFGLGGGEEGKFPARGRGSLWLLALAALGVVLLVFSSALGGGQEAQQAVAQFQQQEDTVTTALPEEPRSKMTAEEEQLGQKLCAMLGQVEGAGRVEVSVRLSSTTRSEFAVNDSAAKKTTEEKDQGGGTRTTTENTGSSQLVMNRSGNGGEQPVIERQEAPHIAGVLVVAEGAVDARVKAKLYEATRVAVGVEPQRILVLPMERR